MATPVVGEQVESPGLHGLQVLPATAKVPFVHGVHSPSLEEYPALLSEKKNKESYVKHSGGWTYQATAYPVVLSHAEDPSTQLLQVLSWLFTGAQVRGGQL